MVREGRRRLKEEPERAAKELPLPRTKLPSREGNSSLSSDVSRWLAANVCTQTHSALCLPTCKVAFASKIWPPVTPGMIVAKPT